MSKRTRAGSEDVQKVLGLVTLVTIVAVGAVLGWRRWGPSPDEEPAPTPLLVLAAASLGGPLQEAEHRFEERNPGWDVQLNLAASNVLRHQIERGAPADLYLSAAPEHVESLLEPGWVRPEDAFDLWTTDLVVVGPRDAGAAAGVREALGAEGRIAVGDRGVPVGDYAFQALENLGLEERVADRLVPMASEPAVVAAVAGGACARGVAYAAGAVRRQEDVRILATFDPASHAPISYRGCVLADAEHRDAARAFLDFLTTGVGDSLMTAAGLRAPTAPLHGN